MSLIDELAAADVDLDDLKLADLGIDVSELGWHLDADGNYVEVVLEQDKRSLNIEEKLWTLTVLDSCRRVHACAVARFYYCKPGQTTWQYSNLFGAVAIVTEADLRMACAHFIRMVDLDGFNPNSSVMVQQELYEGFQYKELTPFFHTFEMTKYIAGISFANEEHAKEFYNKVQQCLKTPAVDVVDEDLDSKEKSYKMVGDKEWRVVDDTITVKVARKYAAGGITDGTEVSWKKKKDLPPELEAALGQAGVSPRRNSLGEAPVSVPPKEKVIDLLQNPDIRRRVNTVTQDGSIQDGVSMVWSKNRTPLTGHETQEQLQQQAAASSAKLKKKRTGLNILKSSKKK